MRSIEAMFHKKVKNKSKAIAVARKEMIEAAKNHEYERAAYIRDYIIKLEGDADQSKDD
jgi:excinuclease UvrABC helicase subunit UvrB